VRGLPLALSVVAARAAANRRFPLAALADEVRDADHDLGVFGGDPATDVRSVFSNPTPTTSTASFSTHNQPLDQQRRYVGHPNWDRRVPQDGRVGRVGW